MKPNIHTKISWKISTIISWKDLILPLKTEYDADGSDSPEHPGFSILYKIAGSRDWTSVVDSSLTFLL